MIGSLPSPCGYIVHEFALSCCGFWFVGKASSGSCSFVRVCYTPLACSLVCSSCMYTVCGAVQYPGGQLYQLCAGMHCCLPWYTTSFAHVSVLDTPSLSSVGVVHGAVFSSWPAHGWPVCSAYFAWCHGHNCSVICHMDCPFIAWLMAQQHRKQDVASADVTHANAVESILWLSGPGLWCSSTPASKRSFVGLSTTVVAVSLIPHIVACTAVVCN